MNIEELVSILNDFRFEYCFTKNIKAENVIIKGIYSAGDKIRIVIENKIAQTLETYFIDPIRQCVINTKITRPL